MNQSYDTSAAREHYLDIRGTRRFVRIWPGAGDGAGAGAAGARRRLPIVLLHDSLGAVELWRDFPAQLAAHSGHPVLAYDRLGFGKSDAHPGRLAPDFIIDEMHSSLLPILDVLGIERAILFGHSVGGGMAVTAAARAPQRVAAVITESAQAFTEELTLQGIRAAQANFADPAQLARLARYHGQDNARAQWVLDAWIGHWLTPAFADWSLASELRALQCPVLALHGDQDEFGSARQPERIASLPQAYTGQGEHLMLADCGHVPHREMPEPVLAAVTDFLRRRLD